jgi:YD repeat-containing protein
MKYLTALLTFTRYAKQLLTYAVIFLFIVFGSLGGAHAAQERYEYDPIGRLTRIVDGVNRVTTYTYDAVGNLKAVSDGGSATLLAPVVHAVSPSLIRRGQTVTMVIAGQSLNVGSLVSSHPSIDLSNLRLGATQIQVSVTIGLDAPLGAQSLTFSNIAGNAKANFTVAPVLPTLRFEASPLAFPPDNVARNVTLLLNQPDVVPHTVAISSSNVSKLVINTTSVTFAAGQVSQQVSLTPKVAGFANINLNSATLAAEIIPVFLTTDFRGVNTSYAPRIGVLVGLATPPITPNTGSGSIFAQSVGLSVGAVLTDLLPRAVTAGTTQILNIRGRSIPAGSQVSFVPNNGLTASTPTVAADGTSISLNVAVDTVASKIPRQVIVKDPSGKVLPFADVSRGQLIISSGLPEIWSVEPMYATAGSSIMFKVRGKNLQGGTVSITPSTNLTIDSQPYVDEPGSEMTLGLQIATLASAGLRTVQVTTPSGVTTANANLSNSLTLVRQIQQVIPSIMAPAVGVLVGTQTMPSESTVSRLTNAQPVGLVVGTAINTVTPRALIRATTVNLVLNGAGLGAVQSISITPTAGLTLGTFSANAAGNLLTIPVTIDAAAEKSNRRLAVKTAAGLIPFAQANGDQLLVSDPIPEVVGIAPQVIQTGTIATLRINGRYLSGATSLRFEPATDMTLLAPPTANAEGNVLTANVQIAAQAASGARTVIVQAGAGESSNTRNLGNSVFVARQLGATYDAIMAQPVGVLVQSNAPPATVQRLTVSPLVGVFVPITPVVNTNSVFAASQSVVVTVGTVVTAISPAKPEGILQGDTVNIVFSGQGLNTVTAVKAFDPAGTNSNSSTTATAISFGTLSVNADGTRLTVPVTVAAVAATGGYRLALDVGTGTIAKRVPALSTVDMSLAVGAAPTINSMTPIVMELGKSYSFVIRGTQLKTAFEVWADAANGVEFVSAPVWSTDTYGESITVSVQVKPSASLGSRVVRLRVPGGSSTATPLPTNTITIFPVQ